MKRKLFIVLRFTSECSTLSHIHIRFGVNAKLLFYVILACVILSVFCLIQALFNSPTFIQIRTHSKAKLRLVVTALMRENSSRGQYVSYLALEFAFGCFLPESNSVQTTITTKWTSSEKHFYFRSPSACLFILMETSNMCPLHWRCTKLAKGVDERNGRPDYAIIIM